MFQSIMARAMRLPPLLVILLAALASFAAFHGQDSADLNALFLAASNYGAGNTGAVYAEAGAVFKLAVPPGWEDQATALGITARPLFPYIYPPLWAAIFAPITAIAGPATFTSAAFLINPALLGFSAVLAHRIMRPAMALTPWIMLSLAFVASTTFGYVALFQNQPQILVSFLILLALERDRSDAPLAAGVALALAASLKLYPALFALFWLAARNHRAFTAFLVAGALLGGASVALAGWPLHDEFLAQIRTIAHSFIASQINYNIDATAAQWVLRDLLVDIAGYRDPNGSEVVNVVASVKPALFRTTDRLILLAVLTVFFIAFLRAPRERQFTALFPAAIISVALASPLTWSYHYLSVVFFLPALTERLPRGWPVFAGFWLLYCQLTLLAFDRAPVPFFLHQILGTAGMVTMLVFFLRQPATPAPQSESA